MNAIGGELDERRGRWRRKRSKRRKERPTFTLSRLELGKRISRGRHGSPITFLGNIMAWCLPVPCIQFAAMASTWMRSVTSMLKP